MNTLSRPPCHDLTLFRGNSADFLIKPVYEDGTDVTLEDGDRILFTVRSRPDAHSMPVYSRVFSRRDYDEDGQIVLHLKPKDTVKFPVHTHWYDVAICFADGSFYTFVPYSRFDIRSALGDVDMLSGYEDNGANCKSRHKVEGIVEKPHTVYVTELEFNSYKEFPNIGEADKLYIATDEDTVYRFDPELMIYRIVGSNPANIKQIFCKLEEE